MRKRGQFSPLFKYIFMLVAGAFILIFFVKFAMDYMGGAEQVEAYKLIQNFDDTLAIRAASERSFMPHDLGLETHLTFFEGTISSGQVSQETSRIVYSPQELTGKSIDIGTMEWLFPYKVDNFFYMTNGRYKHYFVYEGAAVESYIEEGIGRGGFLENLGIEVMPFNDLRSGISMIERSTAGFDRVRFVYVTEASTAKSVDRISKMMDGMENAEVVVIRPVSMKDEEEYGYVTFDDDELPYLGRAMLLGAVFVEGSEDYRFNFERAQQKFDTVTDVYISKARMVSNRAVMGSSCQSAGIVAQGLEGLKRVFVEKSIEEVSPEDLYRKIKVITEQNKDPGVGCPEVF